MLPFIQVSVVSFLVIKFDSASETDYRSEFYRTVDQIEPSHRVCDTDQTRIFRKLVDEFEYQKKGFGKEIIFHINVMIEIFWNIS